jgi:hypothetical protein
LNVSVESLAIDVAVDVAAANAGVAASRSRVPGALVTALFFVSDGVQRAAAGRAHTSEDYRRTEGDHGEPDGAERHRITWSESRLLTRR